MTTKKAVEVIVSMEDKSQSMQMELEQKGHVAVQNLSGNLSHYYGTNYKLTNEIVCDNTVSVVKVQPAPKGMPYSTSVNITTNTVQTPKQIEPVQDVWLCSAPAKPEEKGKETSSDIEYLGSKHFSELEDDEILGESDAATDNSEKIALQMSNKLSSQSKMQLPVKIVSGVEECINSQNVEVCNQFDEIDEGISEQKNGSGKHKSPCKSPCSICLHIKMKNMSQEDSENNFEFMEPKHKCYGTSNTTVTQKQYSDPRKQYSLRWHRNSQEGDNVQAKGNLSAGFARKGKGKYELDDEYYKKHSMYGIDEESESEESDDEIEKEKKKELQRLRQVSKKIWQERIDSKKLKSQESKEKAFKKDYKVDESHKKQQPKAKRRKVTVTDLGPDSDDAAINDDFLDDQQFE